MRTNPAYVTLAYRKAVISETIARLMEYTSSMGTKPNRVIISDEVLREDSEVPEREIVGYIEGLQQEEESIRLEMLKFDFVRRDEQAPSKVRQLEKAPARKRSTATKSAAAKKRKQ